MIVKIDRKVRDRKIRESDILDAAEKVFAERGFFKTTIHDIAKEAQYAVGTIYLYFKDKEELYCTLIENKSRDLIEFVKKEVNDINGSYEKLLGLVEAQLNYLKKNEDFFRIYFSERSSIQCGEKNKLSRNRIIENYMGYIDYIALIIKKAQEEGVVRRDFDSKRIAYTLSSVLNSNILPTWFNQGSVQGEDMKELAGYILDVYLNGVGIKK